MKLILSVAALLILTMSARAELLIFRSSATVQYTGEGTERTLRFRDTVVTDLDSTNGASISTLTVRGRKLYSVSREGTRVVTDNLRGLRGRTYHIIARAVTETNELERLKVSSVLAKGLNGTLQVSAARQIPYPRVFRATAHQLDLEMGINSKMYEAKETRTYANAETRAANAAGEDVDTVVNRIVQRLEASGYQLAE